MNRKTPLLLALTTLALVGCRLVTGTGDLVVDDGAADGSAADTSASTTTGAATTGAGGAGGQGSSASTGGASATGSTSTGVGGAGGGVANCSEYCAELASQCTGAEAQYDTGPNCADYCPYLADGSDPTADTLACRAKFLPPHAVDCQAAGPGGASQCGDPCTNFCIRAIFICPGSYVDLDACTNFCATLPDTDLGSYAAPSGLDDTLQCRLYYLTREVSAPGVFCASVREDSNNCM